MNIAINLLFVRPGEIGGSEVFVHNLVKRLVNLDKQNRYLLIITSRNKHLFSCENVDYLKLNFDNSSKTKRVLYEQFILPWKLKRKKVDLLVNLGNTGLICCPCKSILTIHDLLFLATPGEYSFLKRIYLGFLVRLSCKKASGIAAVSENTRKDIFRYMKVKEDKIKVVYEGVDFADFTNIDKNEAIELLKDKYGVEGEYIYSPTSLFPRKNVDLLVKYFSELKKDRKIRHKLIITGVDPHNRREWLNRIIAEYGLEDEIFYPGSVPDNHIPYIYKAAKLVVYLTSYEGFGLPPLEAMAAGCPVLVSNCASLPEVVGDAGVLVDPMNREEVIAAIRELLVNKDLREKLVMKGLLRVRSFSWDKVTSNFMQLIQAVQSEYFQFYPNGIKSRQRDKIRVLYTLPILDFARGGGVTAAMGLAQAVSEKGVEVTIFAPETKESKNNTERIEKANVKLFSQDYLSKFWTGHSVSLCRAFKENIDNFDLIHIHELWHYPHFMAYQAAKFAEKPYLITTHGELEPWRLKQKAFRKNIYFKMFQKKALENASMIHTIAEGESGNVFRLVRNRNIFHVPNGLNLDEYEGTVADREKCENFYPELKNKIVVLFLGRIHPMKGLNLLAEAFVSISRNRNDVHLVIAGPDDSKGYRKKVTGILKAGGVLKNTTFVGMITGEVKLALLKRTDIFVLPSYSEVLGISTLEAMACGVPVVISRECHFPEVLEAGAGRVIDNSIDQLSAAFTELLENPALRKEMGRRGRELVERKYTWECIADKMIIAYEKILGNYKGEKCRQYE